MVVPGLIRGGSAHTHTRTHNDRHDNGKKGYIESGEKGETVGERVGGRCDVM